MRRIAVGIAALLLISGCGSATAADTLPDATLPCLSGDCSVDLSTLRGPMVINLWASYCAPCREEMPHIQQFATTYAGKVEVLGVDYYDDTRAGREFAKSVGATYRMVVDAKPVIRAPALPVTILLDRDGSIAYQQPIAIESEAQLEQLVEQHLGVSR